MRFCNPFASKRSVGEPARGRPTAPRLTLEPLDDRIVPATLSIADVTVVEGTSGVQNAALTVTLSEPLKKSVTVDYGTGDYTSASLFNAAAGSDYATVSGKLTFSRGETVKTILVPVYGDQVPERDESFYVRLFGAKGATITDGLANVIIVDSSPRLSLSSEFGFEGGGMTFTVTLSAALDTPFTVDFATAPYSAIAGQDYVHTSGTLTFAAGETIKTFTVQMLADGMEEYDEQFSVQLSNPSAPVSTGYGWGYIYGEYGESGW